MKIIKAAATERNANVIDNRFGVQLA